MSKPKIALTARLEQVSRQRLGGEVLEPLLEDDTIVRVKLSEQATSNIIRGLDPAGRDR